MSINAKTNKKYSIYRDIITINTIYFICFGLLFIFRIILDLKYNFKYLKNDSSLTDDSDNNILHISLLF